MTRKGSALLIVLGMMSFMVVSAVAFSMFMRQSRLPSSFLRQRLTASQLVKAGLAGAMQRLDAAIGDNPYPGIGEDGTRKVKFKKNNGDEETVDYGNFWHNRVFMESRLANDKVSNDDDEALDFDPVSTLTLEALAYIPPSLVNTVRYWSKRTSTASWQSLGYDAGRYAFTAVNVSDYFDINRIRANVMRDSSPQNRISIGYLFENDGKSGGGGVSPEEFDKFIGKVTNDVFKTRFVSLADYNVAIGSKAYGDVGFESPFWNYLDSSKRPGDGSFYGSFWDLAKQQKFVTDSWFPGSLDGDTTALYLTDDVRGQPFDGKSESLDELQKGSGSDAYKIIRTRLDLCTLGALYDYIDEDNVPISLAIPTMEHVPMLTGLRITASGFKLALDSKTSDPENKGTQENPEKWYRKAWWVKSLGDDPKVTVSACLAYPFARTSNLTRPGTYEVQVLVRGFLSSVDEDFSKTRLDTGLKPGKGDWKGDSALLAQDKAFISLFGSQKVSVKEGTDENHCVIDCSGIELSAPADALQNAWVYGIYYQQKEDGSIAKSQYDASGDNLGLSPNPKKLIYRGIASKRGAEVGDGTKLKLNFAVWVRVMDGNNTVDLVPAMVSDDQEYNGHNSGDMGGDAPKVCGSIEPVIPLSSGPALNLNKEKFTPTESPTPEEAAGDLAIFCDDPRFNYAPEDWYLVEDGNISPDKWRAAAIARCDGAGRRPNDFFQFVSDAGYLQSMGELQFLPYLTSFKDGNGGVPNGGFYDASKYNGATAGFESRKSWSACANKDYAWQTHWAFRAQGGGTRADWQENDDYDPYEWGIYDTNGGTAVSPYADGELMMAAIANTPYDWTVAMGDNGLTLASGKPYTFGPDSSEANVKWEELQKVAKNIKAEIGTSKEWEEKLFESTRWDDDDGPFGADFGADFHDVDRKFLYSYWRSCFANTQQLFLIFVRAEPSVMGGSSAGHTPSQLGARAVALVWREPESTIEDQVNNNGSSGNPHRMRILFYHQFE